MTRQPMLVSQCPLIALTLAANAGVLIAHDYTWWALGVMAIAYVVVPEAPKRSEHD